jgi:hypothetical protein
MDGEPEKDHTDLSGPNDDRVAIKRPTLDRPCSLSMVLVAIAAVFIGRSPVSLSVAVAVVSLGPVVPRPARSPVSAPVLSAFRPSGPFLPSLVSLRRLATEWALAVLPTDLVDTPLGMS